MSIYFTLITFAVYEREQNFCPKFGRSPIQWRNIDFERETKPDWHTRQKKKIILINSRHFTMDFFFYFQGQDVQHKRSYISYIHRYSSRRVPSQNWSRVAGPRGLQISNQHHENDGKHISPGTMECKTRSNVPIA